MKTVVFVLAQDAVIQLRSFYPGIRKARFHRKALDLERLPDFESIAVAYEPLIRKWLVKYHLLHDFEEYHQIALIALWEAYEKYEAKKGAFPAYAETTVRGKLLTELNKKKRKAEKEIPTDRVPEVTATRKSDLDFDEWKFSLSAREKVWLKEAVMKGVKTSDIAKKYAVSPHTVRSWKKGAVAKIRNIVFGGKGTL